MLRDNRAGVTLLEMVIAVALLALVGLSFGMIHAASHRQLRQNADFSYSQSEASFAMEHIKRNVVIATDIQTPVAGGAGGTLVFTAEPTPGTTVTSTYRLRGGNVEYERNAGSGFTVVARNITVLTFNRTGRYLLLMDVTSQVPGSGPQDATTLTGAVAPRGIL